MEYRLREIEKKDIDLINRWRNDPELITALTAPFRYISQEVDEQWYLQYMRQREKSVRCAIVDREERLVGIVSLTGIDSINRTAEIHIMIGEQCNQNKGAGTFSIQTMVKHGFENMNLNRIFANVLENNKRSRNVFEKSGFTEEGVQRETSYKNGKFENTVLFSILKSEHFRGCKK